MGFFRELCVRFSPSKIRALMASRHLMRSRPFKDLSAEKKNPVEQCFCVTRVAGGALGRAHPRKY